MCVRPPRAAAHVKRPMSVRLTACVRFFPLQYMSNVDSWCKACGEVDLPSELQDLEDAIHHHQGLYEHITAAYSEVTSHLRLANRGGTSPFLCSGI